MLGFRLVDGTLAFFPALVVLVMVPEYFKPVREFAADYHASLDGKNALVSILGIVDEPQAAPVDDAEDPVPTWGPGLHVFRLRRGFLVPGFQGSRGRAVRGARLRARGHRRCERRWQEHPGQPAGRFRRSKCGGRFAWVV